MSSSPVSNITSCLSSSRNHNIKRSKSFGLGVSFAPNKKMCFNSELNKRRNSSFLTTNALTSSDDSDDDDSDDESGYLNNQKKAFKSSLYSRSNSFSNSRISDAISQYSDDEEDCENNGNKENEFDFKKDTKNIKSQRSNSNSSNLNMIPISPVNSITVRKTTPACDQIARGRCFDYLVGAIDEAWARYCDATSYAEDEAYGDVSFLPNTPASIGASDYDDDEEEEGEDEKEEGYKSSATNITEYESDLEWKKISSQPSSVKLQQLKDRLLNAKYYLQDFVDTNDFEDGSLFWKRWDLIKYATIELVEDDDDDEIIESTIDDLEKGRFYGH